MLWKKYHHTYSLLFAKDYQTIGEVGGARVTVFQEIRPGSVFKTDDVAKEKLGGLPPQNDSKQEDNQKKYMHELST